MYIKKGLYKSGIVFVTNTSFNPTDIIKGKFLPHASFSFQKEKTVFINNIILTYIDMNIEWSRY